MYIVTQIYVAVSRTDGHNEILFFLLLLARETKHLTINVRKRTEY